jgi:hypothetical protein
MEFSDSDGDLPLLQTARAVTRHCLPDGCGELPHVTQQLDALIDSFSADWTVVTAYKRTHSLRCVQYVAAREPPETQDPFFKRWLLNRAAELAAERGDLATVQWLMGSYLPVGLVVSVTDVAAAEGHLEILQWLYGHQCSRVCFGGMEICGALENKHELVVEWLRGVAVPRAECRGEVLRSAAKGGNLNVVRWLVDEYGVDASGVLKFAIAGCHCETARWIIERYDMTGGSQDVYFPARHGELSFLKFLASRGIGELNIKALLVAAANGHLEVVKWLHCDRGIKLTVDAMREAAQNGHLDVVQWIFETSSGFCDSSVFVCAAEFGHLDVLQWLQTRWTGGCGTAAIDWAAANGHLDVVTWLHESRVDGCSQRALDDAAVNGFLDVVKWLDATEQKAAQPSLWMERLARVI